MTARSTTIGPVPAAQPTRLAAGGQNAIAVSLGLVGDEWTLLILRHAITAGATRYNEWLRILPISHAVLTNRLSRLVGGGLLTRVPYQDKPVRYAYRLTKRGRDTWPILLSIWSWEQTWVPDHAEQLPRMIHGAGGGQAHCGRPFAPTLTCAACASVVAPRDVTGGFGPSGSWQRSVPLVATRRRTSIDQVTGAGFFPQTMALIGNRWSAALLGAAFLGARRFTDFAQRLGAPQNIVAERLRTFGDLGVLASGPGGYRLTAKGRAFFPVVMCTIDWAQRWYRAPEGPAMEYRHEACGGPFLPRLRCDRCAGTLRGADVIVQPGARPG
jgi:DNA-binding HxlR family transcriptional regulator